MKNIERDYLIPSDSKVTVTKMNHLVEVQYMEKCNGQIRIRKLDSTHYLDLVTGEIREFELSDNRGENYNSLRKTFKRLRYLINNNFVGGRNELFVTLTYKENMQDRERLYDDFKKFIKRFRYKYQGMGSVDYLSVVEPQARGAWHMHVLIRFNQVANVFIPNKEIAELWGHGFVHVRAVNNIDNIGAYLTAYLADIELTDDVTQVDGNVVVKEVEGQKKAFIKGGRLHLYPAGMNLYRCSRGIKKPDRVGMSYDELKKVVKGVNPHYSQVISINDEMTGFSNTIIYEQYNMKRGLIE